MESRANASGLKAPQPDVQARRHRGTASPVISLAARSLPLSYAPGSVPTIACVACPVRSQRSLRRPKVISRRRVANRSRASEPGSHRPSPRLRPRECDSAASRDGVTSMPRVQQRWRATAPHECGSGPSRDCSALKQYRALTTAAVARRKRASTVSGEKSDRRLSAGASRPAYP
jgi:hypothetical protein